MTGLKTSEENRRPETAEETLQASEEKYRLITENMRDVMWQTTPDLVITYVTSSVNKLLGYQPDELVGQHLTHVLTSAGQELLRERYPDIMRRLEEHKEFDSEVSIVEQIRKDGTTVWTEVVSTPVFDGAGQFMGFQGVTRDVSKRKEDKDTLRASEEKYRNLVESISDAFFSLDENMVVTYFNQEASNVLGRRREEIIGHRLFEVFPEASGSIFEEHYTRALKEKIALSFETYFEIQPYANWYHVRVYPQSEGISVFFQLITERKKAEDALRESEERYRSLVEHLPQRIFIKDRNSVYLSCNENYASDLEITPEQIVDKDDFAFHPPELAKAYRVSDQACMATGMAIDTASPYQHDGQERWVHSVKVPYHNSQGQIIGVLGIFEDITERKRAEEALRESEKRFRLFYEKNPLGYQSLNADGRFLEVNQAWLDTLGYERSEVIGKWFGDFLAPENVELFRQRFPRFLELGEVHDVEFVMINKSGIRVIVTFDGKIGYDQEGRFVQTHCVLTDVTERKRLEEERLEMERKLLHAQKIESLNIMAGGIAHDFNNQLAIVLGNLELALFDRGLDPEVRLSIENAVKAAKRSAELSHQMQIYTGNTLHHSVDLDLKELLIEKPSLLKLCISKDVTLNLDIYRTLPAIKGDADQLQRLVMNILVNASEAIGNQNGAVTLRTGVMDCDETYLRQSRLEEMPAPGRFVFLEVTDTGCGMDAETEQKLFDPFFTTKFWGRGLGMAEVIGIVKSHHGAIIIDSEAGEGTTIRVLFPASEKAHALSARAMNMVESVVGEQVTVIGRKTILVVEDESGLRDLGVKRLEHLGYRTIVAGDGKECINVFRERLNEIDLVMLDYKMPKMDGAEVFEELIRIKPDVKVILCSGYAEDVVMRSFPGQLPAGVLHKPYNMEALKGELDRVLMTTG